MGALIKKKPAWVSRYRPFRDLPYRDNFVRVKGPDTNPFFPLPSFWEQIESEEDRAWWRVNACCNQETPQEFLVSFIFFFYTYFWEENTGALENRRVLEPFHHQVILDIGANKFNGIGAPRYSYKTSLMRALAIFLLLTRRGYRIVYIASIQSFARDFLEKVREQLDSNPYLLHDFGQVKSKRGVTSWNSDKLRLAWPFRSSLRGAWLKGGNRGLRGDWLLADDVEMDPKTEEAVPENTKKLEWDIHHRYMPYIEIAAEDLDTNIEVARRGQGMTIAGTIIGEGMFLPRLLSDRGSLVYSFWNKLRFDQEAEGWYLWPSRWGPSASASMKAIMTEDAYNAEQRGRPGYSASRFFPFSSLFHTYRIDTRDEAALHDPYKSKSIVEWPTRIHCGQENAVPTWHRMHVCDWMGMMDVAILVDWADIENVSAQSDFTCFHAVGLDSARGALWSLGMSLGRYNRTKALDEIIRMCITYKPRQLVMESVGGYGALCDLVYDAIREPLLRAIGWLPVPIKKSFNTNTESKPVRISRIHWRFLSDRIYFPLHLLAAWPYSQLLLQVERFTMSMKGLRNDDAIDTLGLVPYTFGGLGGFVPATEGEDGIYQGLSVQELLEKGITHTSDGHSLLECINRSQLTGAAERAVRLAESNQREQLKGAFWRRRKHVRPVSLFQQEAVGY